MQQRIMSAVQASAFRAWARGMPGVWIRLPLPFKLTQTSLLLTFRPEEHGEKRVLGFHLWTVQLLCPLRWLRPPLTQRTAHSLSSPSKRPGTRHWAEQCEVVDGEMSTCCSFYSYLQDQGTQGQRPPTKVTWLHKASMSSGCS